MQRRTHIEPESLLYLAESNSIELESLLPAGLCAAVSCKERRTRARVPATVSCKVYLTSSWSSCCRLLERSTLIELESLLPTLAKSNSHRAEVSAAVSCEEQLTSSWGPSRPHWTLPRAGLPTKRTPMKTRTKRWTLHPAEN